MKLLELYNCEAYEELKQKLQNENPEVKDLKEFLDYLGKEKIIDKKNILSEKEAVDYVNNLDLDQSKNHLLLLNSAMVPISKAEINFENSLEISNQCFKEVLEVPLAKRAIFIFNEQYSKRQSLEIKEEIEKKLRLIDATLVETLRPIELRNQRGFETNAENFYKKKDSIPLEFSSVFETLNINQNISTENKENNPYSSGPLKDFLVKEGYGNCATYPDLKKKFFSNSLLVESFEQLLKKQLEKQTYDPLNLTQLEKTLRTEMGELNKEKFKVLLLNQENEIIESKNMFAGTLDRSAIYPRELIKELYGKDNIASVVFVHNHPSGNETPSNSDKEISRQLKDALEIIGIKTLDHLVITKGKCISMANQGYVDFDEYERKEPKKEIYDPQKESKRMANQYNEIKDMLDELKKLKEIDIQSGTAKISSNDITTYLSNPQIGDSGSVQAGNNIFQYNLIKGENELPEMTLEWDIQKEKTSSLENENHEKTNKPRDQFVEYVIASLEKGKIPWEKDWENERGPYNPITNKEYTGKNTLILNCIEQMNDYKDPRWMTFNQAKEKGYKIKPGSKSVPLKYFYDIDKVTGKPVDKEMLASLSREEKEKYKKNLKTVSKNFNVFNAKQIEGIPLLEKTIRTIEFSKIDKILENSNINIIYGGNRAFYSPDKDIISLPEKKQFKSENSFYGTALHELAHSTGHSLRLNREFSGKFGTSSYAKEELRAEFASVFIGQEKGLNYSERHLENSTQYLKGWIQVLKSNPDELYKAAQDAHTISKTILSYENQKQPSLLQLKNQKQEKDKGMEI